MKKRSGKYRATEHYFQKAKQDNYLARSVYKLEEIDSKYSLIKRGYRVLDLGCVPGSWLQYCSGKVGEKGVVVGVDSSALTQKFASNVCFIHQDIAALDPKEIIAVCPAFDVILSDMAPATSGIKSLDQERSLQLVFKAWEFAQDLLKPGGSFLAKIFQGAETKVLMDCLKTDFMQVKTVKPKTSGRSRLEIYFLAQGKLK